MASPLNRIKATTKEKQHEGIGFFGWQFCASPQLRLDDLNPFARMNWRNFDLGFGVEWNTASGRSVEAHIDLLIVSLFIDIYERSSREAFADHMNAIRDEHIANTGEGA